MQKVSGYKYRRGNIWYIAYTDFSVDGGLKRESSGSSRKGDAQILLDRRLKVARNKAYGFKETDASYNQHFKDFLNLYKQGTETHKTYKGVLKLFCEFLEDKYPGLQFLHEFDATPKIFSDYKIWLKSEKMTPGGTPHKDWTLKNHLKVLKTVFLQAKDWRIITNTPNIDTNIPIRDSKPIVPLNKQEDFALFFERCKKLKPEYYAPYFLITMTGLRFGEMCNLRWSDVNLKEGYITIKTHKEFSPKGRRKRTGLPKERTITLTKDTIKILNNLPRSDKYDNVFLKKGEPINRKEKSFRRGILAIVRGTSLEGMSRNHELRHTTGHILADKGVTKDVIADILGHSDIRTTELYTGKPQRPKAEAIKKLEGFGKR